MAATKQHQLEISTNFPDNPIQYIHLQACSHTFFSAMETFVPTEAAGNGTENNMQQIVAVENATVDLYLILL
jgi:hypothetical protein